MKTLFKLSLFLLIPIAAPAQSPETIQQEAMKKMEWWIGDWKGRAYSSMGEGRKDTTDMRESIRLELNGTIILVEGTGHRVRNNIVLDEVVHHAFAVLSFDEKSNTYQWKAWRVPGGIYTEYEPVVEDRRFSWAMKMPQGNMRYQAVLEENQEWHETGEFSRDGNAWYPFFEMRLFKTQ